MKAKQVVFITGASTGIGRALALELAARGCALALTARRQALLDELAVEVEQRGGAALALACDVTEPAQVKAAIAATQERFGRIDWAILNAGISRATVADRFKAAEFEQLLQTNLLGVAYGLEELIPLLRAQGGGKLVAVSSLAADRGFPGYAGYCATKAALTTLCEGLRGPLRAHGIELVTVAPGYVETPMTEKLKHRPLLMPVEEAARLIVRRLERGDSVIRFPWLASLATGLARLLPARWFDALSARGGG